ncbi:MAG: hypothetical protein A2Z17_03365 [Gammaproteobacteria bacterium RBG_16_66_13]|nr:MAG: hypothetical protein A2Z17_03365 [Gammaproteobacteria bacterium RBG_16_66_13]
MAADGLQQAIDPPNKHARVPGVPPVLEVLFGQGAVRLLFEANRLKGLRAAEDTQPTAALNVAVPGIGRGRRDSESDQCTGLGYFASGLQ